MGLLDSLMGDPQTAGLLGGAAGMADMSGPSLMPHSFGQVMSAGLKGAQDGMARVQDQQMKMAQLKMLQLQEQRAQNLFEMQKSAFNSVDDAQQAPQMQPAMPGQMGSGMYGDVAPPTGMSAMPAMSQPSGGMPAELRQLKKFAISNVPGSKELWDIYKWQAEGIPLKPGEGRLVNGQPIWNPDSKTGFMGYGPNGQILQSPNFNALTGATAQATAGGTEAGKAPYQTQMITPPGGRPTLMANDQVYAMLHPGQIGVPPSMSQPPIAQTPATPDSADMSAPSLGKIPVSVQSGRDKTAIALALQEVNDAKPEDKPQAMAVYKEMVRRSNAGASAITGTPLSGPMTMPKGGVAAQPIAPQPSIGGGIQLQSPAEAADALDQVKLKNAPALAAANKTAEGAAAAGQVYQTELHKKVEGSRDLVRRNAMIEPLLDKFTTGGMAADQRLELGNAIQNLSWVPTSMKNSVAGFVANGDPRSGKLIQNQLAAAGVSNMLQVLDKEAVPNRAIFNAIHDAQESIKTGNGTLKDVFKIQKMVYDNQFGEQQALTKSVKDGSYDPRTWQGDYSAVLNDSIGKTPAVGSDAKPSNTQTPMPSMPTPNASNKGRMIVEHDTGKKYRSNGLQWTEVK